MSKKRLKRKKFSWWRKAKRWMSKLISRQETKIKPIKKRKKRKRRRRQLLSPQQIWHNSFLQFKSKKRKRRSKKLSLFKKFKKIIRSCFNSITSLQQQIKKLLVPKKRRRRRKRKQYAVYVMSNQKKVD